MDLGFPELLIILVLILLLFGGAKLPALARSLGHAKKEFEAGLKASDSDTPTQPGDAPKPGTGERSS